MPNEIVPDSQGHWWDSFNLPALAAGPAGPAISRLIGGFAEIPAAWLDRWSQRIRQQDEAKRIVNTAIAQAVANKASQDEGIVNRAMETLVAKEYRKQTNKEAIAKKTIELLEYTPEQPSENPTGEPIDDDWMNVFERHAEQASSDRLQDIWARVLAGQIRKPQAFSLKTLNFVAQLDATVAEVFERFSNAVMNGRVIPKPNEYNIGNDFSDLRELEDFGLLSGVSAPIGTIFVINTYGYLAIWYRNNGLLIKGKPDTQLRFSTMPLTRVGREVYQILQPVEALDQVKSHVELLPKDELEWIGYGKCSHVDGGNVLISDCATLWTRPTE